MITDDPLRIEVGDVEMYIDLGAEQVLHASIVVCVCVCVSVCVCLCVFVCE